VAMTQVVLTDSYARLKATMDRIAGSLVVK
jgi:hypothetical protein